MSIVPCTNTPIVTGIVAFDPAAFIVLYPEFSSIDPAILSRNFALAQLQLNNSCGSRVCAADVREMLLDLLVAHLTFLSNGANGVPAPGIVGRIANATEGSVSVGAEYNAPPSGSMAYYIQTKYGAQYWQSTARWRLMVYLPGRSNADVYGPGFAGPYGPGFPGCGPC